MARSHLLLFRSLKMAKNFVFGCIIFLPNAKSGITNYQRNESSNISYLSSFSRDLSDIKIFSKQCPSVEKS